MGGVVEKYHKRLGFFFFFPSPTSRLEVIDDTRIRSWYDIWCEDMACKETFSMMCYLLLHEYKSSLQSSYKEAFLEMCSTACKQKVPASALHVIQGEIPPVWWPLEISCTQEDLNLKTGWSIPPRPRPLVLEPTPRD